MIDSRILGAHGSCALCLCVFALVLSLSTALIFVDADAASAYCVGDDGPADTRTWSAVSGAREISQGTGTTCDGLGDYHGRVNDWAPGNGKCAYHHHLTQFIRDLCQNETNDKHHNPCNHDHEQPCSQDTEERLVTKTCQWY